jgi:hypothetical protein
MPFEGMVGADFGYRDESWIAQVKSFQMFISSKN